MAASPLQLPAFPPAGPWDAYVLFILWLPFIIRALLLAKPMRQVINKLSPHAGWAVKQLRTLPVKGMGLLVFNEIFAFLIPPMLVLGLRLFIDPIGWQSWSEVTNLGGTLLLMALFFWITMDFYRVARVRRMLSAVLKQDVNKLRKVADAGLKARAWLRRVSGREKNKPVTKEEVNESGKEVVKNSLKVWAGRAMLTRKLTLRVCSAVSPWVQPSRLEESGQASFRTWWTRNCSRSLKSAPTRNRKRWSCCSFATWRWASFRWSFSPWYRGWLAERHLHALPSRGRFEAPACPCSS